ncbi:hypothetical protein DQ240_11535 [Blastococcus sp. TF02A-26]|nr:hypothetical protein DQ240_11535 [Blastococcus sp. TF02A-26]
MLAVTRIREELEDYRAIGFDEHLAAVGRQQRNQVGALARGVVVSGEALEEAAELARSRAHQGIDVEVLIGAYHLGDQVLWQALVAAADAETSEVLPTAASLMFASLHAISTALAAAHAGVTQAIQSRRITASQRLVELLLTASPPPEASVHARALELDPAGEFVALLWRREDGAEAAVPAGFIDGLENAGAQFAVGYVDLGAVVVCQRVSAAQVAEAAHDRLGGHAGVGLLRRGLSGAATSVGDARLAAYVARTSEGGTAMLEDVWPEAGVQAEAGRLTPVFEVVAEVAAAHPHLVDAVRAFAAGDMQLTRTAQLLHLHANSVSYRLERWAGLTGWNPRTFDGLRRSLLAIGSVNDGQVVDGDRDRRELLDQP